MSTFGGVGTAVPSGTTAFDDATGLPVSHTSPTGGTITRSYDQLGRQMTYTDADGGTARYDALDRPTTVTERTVDHLHLTAGTEQQTTCTPSGTGSTTGDSWRGDPTAVMRPLLVP
ncbi:RHS repeat protein [Streptomyces europaeiscabiei]|uniref:RHS repeat domain-containing protein n=1 Tax=Streptomyces europaeiscabiei TaxID=146819 RepID=UPI0029BB52A9|nr:RHS repeat domain-containing protein [Streptomyces europaeiscabiei]MDX3631142.1 RHS repeat protein [Streptomyces europaeiscabiei]MDX3647622.1 RHS repeat protein [Streptomyces europaeiscabiei]